MTLHLQGLTAAAHCPTRVTLQAGVRPLFRTDGAALAELNCMHAEGERKLAEGAYVCAISKLDEVAARRCGEADSNTACCRCDCLTIWHKNGTIIFNTIVWNLQGVTLASDMQFRSTARR
eukprot:SAG11_NODE_4155_length_2037_cov_0.977296_4_plen_120_part_00